MKKTTRLVSVLLVVILCLSVLPVSALAAGSSGWKQDDYGNWQYYSNGYPIADQWKKSGGSWYYFDDYGIMVSGGLYQIDDTWYCFKDSGALLTGWKQFFMGSESIWMYFTSNGMVTGWKKIGGSWYFFEDGSNDLPLGVMYQSDTYGSYASAIINNEEFAFKSSGAMVTGWVHYTDDYGNYLGWAYYTSSGARAQSGYMVRNGRTYYFSDGWCTNP